MAVTQQLARVPVAYLERCRTLAAERADGDHGFDPPAADCLDLDWAPFLLKRVAELGGLDQAPLAALHLALDGDPGFDLAFLNRYPYAIAAFGGTPTALAPAEVARAAGLLHGIDLPALWESVSPEDLGPLSQGITGGARRYAATHFAALFGFYAEAARRGLAVVLWWD
ncbi:DUF1877 family protein [Kitasatospora sp. NPDC101176]|uniref:DUF1877 family protein n=1 Tax=Kitasatospora sp. NPDC101176 TaxID=3364099 RepID=UPI00381D11DE